MLNILGENWYDGIYVVHGIHRLQIKKSPFLLQGTGPQNYKQNFIA